MNRFVAIALMFSSSLALAEDKKSAEPPMPVPAPELGEYMKSMEGTWKCDTKFPADAMGPGSPAIATKATVKIKKELNGFWYNCSYAIAKSKAMPGFQGSFFFGYDPTTKQVMSVSMDDAGGFVIERGVPKGDDMVMTGEGFMMGMKVKVRETMTKKGPKDVVHKMEVDMGKGYQLMGEDVCKK